MPNKSPQNTIAPDADRRLRQIAFSTKTHVPRWALLQIISALPDDAILRFTDIEFAHDEYCMCLTFCSGEFEHVPLGETIPSATAWIDSEEMKAGLGPLEG